ncbi:MAG TPA: hypothetical protein VJG65_02325 [Patescibacteria group bacterium]|nr:hypothetical protein [Patescibacteria group bacterium]
MIVCVLLMPLYFVTRDFHPGNNEPYEYLDFFVTGTTGYQIYDLARDKLVCGPATEEDVIFFQQVRRKYSDGFAIIWRDPKNRLWFSLAKADHLVYGQRQRAEIIAKTPLMPTAEETMDNLFPSDHQVIAATR